MTSPVDVNELFVKCMTDAVAEKLTATTVATYITSPFAIHCNNFVSEAERDEVTEYQNYFFNEEMIMRINIAIPNFLI